MQEFPINSLENKQHALRAVMAILGSDGMEVVIRKRVESGSKKQKAWFNMLAKMIADDTGNNQEAVKAHVKEREWGKHEAEVGGVKIVFIPRSDYYGMKGYSQLIEGIYLLGAELGIVLPDPKPKRKAANG